MYSMDPMAWHAAAYSANLYRGYEAAAAAHDGMWPPQGHHHHMNSFIPNNAADLAEPNPLALASASSDPGAFATASNITAASAAASTRPMSPSEYKVFNNNESRADQEVKTTVRPSPDSGLAVSEAMSNSGSPGGGGGGQGHHHQSHLQPQGSPIPGSNLVVRPQPARSPYEWMKRPTNGLQNRPSKEGK